MATVYSEQDPSYFKFPDSDDVFQFPDSDDLDVQRKVKVPVVPVASVVAGPKTILQKTPKYHNKPTLVSPEDARRKHTQSVDPIPGMYVDTITKGFGPNADLYRDVLMVDPTIVSAREVRIAYFRRGRQVLAEGGGVRGLDEAASLNEVSNRVRTRFQAVSMAYEIVSNPTWKESYLQKGLVYSSSSFTTRVGVDDGMSVDTNDPVSGSAVSVPPKPVRWKENVEELVFEQEPGEAQFTQKPKKKKKRKNKIRVMVDTHQLDEHLEKLDMESEKNFVPDFWDNLEESLDGLLKLATTEKGNKKLATTEKGNETKKEAQPVPKKPASHDSASVMSDDTDASSFDEIVEDAIFDVQSKQRNPTPTSDQAICDKESKRKVDTPSPFRPISPENQSVKDTKSVQSAEGDLFDLESIVSGFSEVKNLSTAQKAKDVDVDCQDRVAPIMKKLSDSSGEDDIFAGLDDEDDNDNDNDTNIIRFTMEKPEAIEITQRTQSESPSSVSLTSALSDMSGGSVAVSTTPSRKSATSQTKSLEATDASTACTQLCDPESIEVATPVSPESSATKQSSDTEGGGDGFMEYFIYYITALVHECADMGAQLAEVDWDDTILGAFMVHDVEVDGMLNILEREIKTTPTVDVIEAVRSFDAIGAVRSFG
jgi:curved DNA-binding protein CbpA